MLPGDASKREMAAEEGRGGVWAGASRAASPEMRHLLFDILLFFRLFVCENDFFWIGSCRDRTRLQGPAAGPDQEFVHVVGRWRRDEELVESSHTSVS